VHIKRYTKNTLTPGVLVAGLLGLCPSVGLASLRGL
jgi:hypothetical protein